MARSRDNGLDSGCRSFGLSAFIEFLKVAGSRYAILLSLDCQTLLAAPSAATVDVKITSGVGMLFSTMSKIGLKVASLINGISHISSVRTGEQMIWPDARRIIAFVTDMQPARDISVAQCPRDTVGIGCAIGSTANAKLSVSRLSPSACPQPASIGLFDLSPESFSECFTRHA